jgi:hypothetical protein
LTRPSSWCFRSINSARVGRRRFFHRIIG